MGTHLYNFNRLGQGTEKNLVNFFSSIYPSIHILLGLIETLMNVFLKDDRPGKGPLSSLIKQKKEVDKYICRLNKLG